MRTSGLLYGIGAYVTVLASGNLAFMHSGNSLLVDYTLTEIPDDNPILSGVRSHVFSYGHRNPQGIAIRPDEHEAGVVGPAVVDEVGQGHPRRVVHVRD